MIATCPICGTPLEVPAPYAGKEVRCAVCEAVFAAPGARRPRPARTPVEADDQAVRRREQRERALRQVAGPALALMAVGWLGVLAGLAVAGLGGAWTWWHTRYRGDIVFDVSMVVTGGVVMMCWGGIVASGATKLRRMLSYGYATTGALAALVPCNPAWPISAPLALWALAVMNREDVKPSFP